MDIAPKLRSGLWRALPYDDEHVPQTADERHVKQQCFAVRAAFEQADIGEVAQA